MNTRYLSYDIREGNDYTKLYKFIEKHQGKEITKSLYLFKTAVDMDAFVTELRGAVAGNDSVYIIYKAEGGLAHRQVAAK